MKYITILFFFLLISCAYPDIDSVPDFNDNKLEISEEEAIDLCKLSNTNNIELMKCLVAYYEANSNL